MPPVKYHYGKFPPDNLDLSRLLPLVGPASAALARFEGTLRGIPNADILLAPLSTQEAVLSSRIEGTQTTVGEVLEYEAGVEVESSERKADINEVINYRSALNSAMESMKSLPLSLRVINESHRVLMQGVRGEDKAPGIIRKLPVFIGDKGGGIENARFIPADGDHVAHATSDWEHYLHAKAPDALIQLAIVHAEFESIHPYLDGNGRIGRLLVPLFLVHKGLLQTPSFYLSAYLEQHRDEYYDHLLAVSRDDDWTGWCEFFLVAITVQAEENENKVIEIIRLYEEAKEWILEATHSQYAVLALDWFFSRPIFRSTDFVTTVGIPEPTAIRLLRIAREDGLLRYIREPSGRRPGILVFPDLWNITDGRTAV
jgi:Fic family protein